MQDYAFKPDDPSHSHKLQFIDNLRAFAILLVILHHIGELFPNAAYIRIISPWCKGGVQLFFVMSAFTMCYTGSKLTLKSKSVLSFYIKRFFRIAPMYYIAIIGYWYLAYVTANVSGVKMMVESASFTKANILANVFFLHGLYPAANNSIVPGGWSIGCEMLFYLIFPFLLSLVRISKWYLLLVQAISLAAVAGLLAVAKLNGHHGVGGDSSFTYYFIANQMPLFLLGILLFMLWESKAFFKTIVAASIIGVGAVIVFNYTVLSTWAWILLPSVLGLVSCVFAKLISRIKLSSVFESIGKVSYSMYISHFVFLWLVAQLFGRVNIDSGKEITAVFAFVLVTAFSFLFSKLSYQLIEAPFINIGRNLAKGLGKADDKKHKPLEVIGSK